MILGYGRRIAIEFGILATVFCSLDVGWFQIEPFLSIGIGSAYYIIRQTTALATCLNRLERVRGTTDIADEGEDSSGSHCRYHDRLCRREESRNRLQDIAEGSRRRSARVRMIDRDDDGDRLTTSDLDTSLAPHQNTKAPNKNVDP